MPGGTTETLETGPSHRTVDSGPEEEKSSPEGATSSSLSVPVGWGLTMETSVSTELATNLGLGLTMVTEVTVELATGLYVEERSTLTNAMRLDTWAWKRSNMPDICAIAALDIASTFIAPLPSPEEDVQANQVGQSGPTCTNRGAED